MFRLLATINVSSDGEVECTNGIINGQRPTITITTTRSRSATIPHSKQQQYQQQPQQQQQQHQQHSITYNIPIQREKHQNQHQHQQFKIPVSMLLSTSDNNCINENIINNQHSNNTTVTTELNGNQLKINLSSGSGNKLYKPETQVAKPVDDTSIDAFNQSVPSKAANGGEILHSSGDEQAFVLAPPMCSKCNEAIDEPTKGVRVMDSLFHLYCFECQLCSMTLHDKNFYALDNNAYCESCYNVSLNVNNTAI